ncbi:hypothetical protein ACFQZX_05825 [Mucilaginibacter litoreus]|uniref:Uncharacterized protein n=1 Tax=Mucilaginibacter litoreus TaxID=1048221 RepID=A0ABW3AQ31_9SPHI
MGGHTMHAVSTRADKKRDPKTAARYYINLPLGLNHEQFVKAVQESEGTVYTAMLKHGSNLEDPAASLNQKNEALEIYKKAFLKILKTKLPSVSWNN